MDRNDKVVAELIHKCHTLNATRLAEMEYTFRAMGLLELAFIVGDEGRANAGTDYEIEYREYTARRMAGA